MADNEVTQAQVELGAMPVRMVRQIDKLTGVERDVFVDREEIPEIGAKRKLGGYVFVVVSITETEKDADDLFTVTWKLV